MILYRITCGPTGKIYIGITKYAADRRWKRHWQNARREPLSQHPMHIDMRAIPIERWTFDIIGSAASYQELLDLERSTIADLRSSDPSIGYNRTCGGQGILGLRFKKTPEQIEKSARFHRGKKLSAERMKQLGPQLAWMRLRPRPSQQNPARDAEIMAHYFSSPSLAATGADFGIKAPAVSHALSRCRSRIADAMNTDPLYADWTPPSRIHPDHLES